MNTNINLNALTTNVVSTKRSFIRKFLKNILSSLILASLILVSMCFVCFSAKSVELVDSVENFDNSNSDPFADFDSTEFSSDKMEKLEKDREDGKFCVSVDPTECSKTLVEVIVDTFHAPKILQKEFYSRSNTPINREIHDLPEFCLTHAGEDRCFGLKLSAFFNQMSDVYFCGNSPSIKNYVNFGTNGLLNELITQVASMETLGNWKPEELIPLFQNITLQERRVGAYFDLFKRAGNWTFQYALPIYYFERNFFLTQDQRNDVMRAPFIREAEAGSNEDAEQVIMMQHLVADKIGFGDMRFHALYTPTSPDDCRRWTLGGHITLPTAFAVRSGIIGGTFCKSNCVPSFSLYDILAPYFCNSTTSASQRIEINTKLENIGYAALDKLTSILADFSLGNNGHVILAPLIEYERQLDDYWGFESQFVGEYWVPANEQRFFLKKVIPADFNDRDYANPDLLSENLAFLDQKFIDTLFPSMREVTVIPGLVGHINLSFDYKPISCMKIKLGYDLYAQGKERMRVSQEVHDNFYVPKAKNAAILQQKIFGFISTNWDFGHDRILSVNLKGDVTLQSTGLGKDFSIVLDAQLNF